MFNSDGIGLLGGTINHFVACDDPPKVWSYSLAVVIAHYCNFLFKKVRALHETLFYFIICWQVIGLRILIDYIIFEKGIYLDPLVRELFPIFNRLCCTDLQVLVCTHLTELLDESCLPKVCIISRLLPKLFSFHNFSIGSDIHIYHD